MQRYILTGAPGSGKTALLRLLEAQGHDVVEEAATDVIALAQARGDPEPWGSPGFIDAIVDLQRRRLERPAAPGAIQFVDRSPVCTYALARFLGREPTAALSAELERIARERVYQRRVFFIVNLGFCTPTAARRISYEDSLRFEQVHAEAYDAFGYERVMIAPGPVDARREAVLEALQGR